MKKSWSFHNPKMKHFIDLTYSPCKRARDYVDYAVIERPVEGYVEDLDVQCVAVHQIVTFDEPVLAYRPGDTELEEVTDLLDDLDELLVEILPAGGWVRPFKPYKQADLALAALATLLEGMPSATDPAGDPYPLLHPDLPSGWSLTLDL